MSKEEAIEILSEMRSEYNLFGDEEEATRYHVLSWAIKEMNAESVRHGHWENKPHKMVGESPCCSVCGGFNPIETKFCPNCGAIMDNAIQWQWEEPEINPCRGCEDYDGQGGCLSKGGCAERREDDTQI